MKRFMVGVVVGALLVAAAAAATPTPPTYAPGHFFEVDELGNVFVPGEFVVVITLVGQQPDDEFYAQVKARDPSGRCAASLQGSWLRRGVTLVCMNGGRVPIYMGETP